MIDEDADLERRYRAPRAFGPAPGPRNIPFSQRAVAGRPDEVMTSLSVTLDADPAQLSRLLPADTRLSGAPALTVSVTRFENLVWLAGRGYPILTVTIPVEYVGDAEALPARYLAVLWEGLSDPVTTGRDELGFPKLFADIRAPLLDDVSAAGAVDADAAWDGFRFVEIVATDLAQTSTGPTAPPVGTLVHRYLPSLTEAGEADVDHLVHHPGKGDDPNRPVVTDLQRGTGRFTFHHARFEDSPIQYPVVNALAALSLAGTGPATLTRSTAAPGTLPGPAAPRLLGGTVPARTMLGVS